MLYSSTGTLRYSIHPRVGHRLVLEADPEIVNYYRALVPKWIKSNSQMHPAHVSVIRYETPALDNWGKYEGEAVVFYYDSTIHQSPTYLWLNVFSQRLEEVRLELGLFLVNRYHQPPPGFNKCFHMTIGNFKS